MPAAVDARRWLAAHPTWADAGLGLLVLVPATLARPPSGSPQIFTDLTLGTFVLLLLSCAALAWRRQRPWLVWAVTTGFGLAGVVLEQGPSRTLIPAIVAVYTVSTISSTRAAVIAAAVSALAPVLIILLTADLSPMDALAYGLVPWSVLGAVTGIAVRNQRALLQAARERARLAEATREDEARRRVGEERLRIARELHDVLAHHISLINVQAGVAAHFLRRDPDQSAEALAHVREASQVVLNEVPGLLGLLRTPDDGLETSPSPTLANAGELVEQARRSGLQVTWQVHGNPAKLAPSVDLAAYRVIQEALTNAGRHGLGRATLIIAHDPEGCTIEVRNAFRPETDGDDGVRLGLIGMRERVSAVGGTLDAGPMGHGEWRVKVRLDAHAGHDAAGTAAP